MHDAQNHKLQAKVSKFGSFHFAVYNTIKIDVLTAHFPLIHQYELTADMSSRTKLQGPKKQ
jgi:hypothetical protein